MAAPSLGTLCLPPSQRELESAFRYGEGRAAEALGLGTHQFSAEIRMSPELSCWSSWKDSPPRSIPAPEGSGRQASSSQLRAISVPSNHVKKPQDFTNMFCFILLIPFEIAGLDGPGDGHLLPQES